MSLQHSRRDFLRHTLAFAAVSGAMVDTVWGAQMRSVVADTTLGKIRGADIDGIKIFKGVPYGATTAGKNRFMPPVEPAKWTNIRDTLEYGHSAPQTEPGTPRNVSDLAVAGAGLTAEGEDCLVLNVWTPALDSAKRPVMFWCHGGGFATGSGASPVTEGTSLARRSDVVVVTINHRLNVLGFTHFGELAGADFSQSGDVGMLDIVQALKWVRDNIAQFGGDPNNVTIFGQSGGGRKVGTLLGMPSARGLFHRAIIESGPTIRLVEREQAARVASELMTKLGLNKSQVRELQTLPVDRIMSAYFAVVRSMNVDQMTMGFSPTMDGHAIPHHPFHPTASEESPTVPLMLGSARTELTNGAAPAMFSMTDQDMRGRIKSLLGANAEPVLDVYRKANAGATPPDLYFLIASDARYGAPIMKIAERRAALNKAPVYLYYFRWESPVDGGRLKSPHTIEIPFAFHNVKASRLTSTSQEAPALADKVSDAWVAFARKGDPNVSSLPRWTAFNPTDRPTMVFNNESRVVNDPIKEQRIAMFKALNLT